MQRTTLIGLAGLAVLVAACTPNTKEALSEEARQSLLVQSRGAAGQLGKELKAKLVAAIEEGGPVQGIEVCSEIAPDIAQKISSETGLEVGRTAIKFRNKGNAPDDFETLSLQSFIADMDAGKPASELEAWALTQEQGKTVFRWMKPIEMGGLCQTCHGSAISSEVQTAIDKAYPDDLATGFEPGELRGAFTVRKVLD